MGSLVVHAGQFAIVVGALATAGRSWRVAGAALGYLALAIVQPLAVGDTDGSGGWVHGFHGMLALVVLLVAVAYAQWAARRLRAPGAGG